MTQPVLNYSRLAVILRVAQQTGFSPATSEQPPKHEPHLDAERSTGLFHHQLKPLPEDIRRYKDPEMRPRTKKGCGKRRRLNYLSLHLAAAVVSYVAISHVRSEDPGYTAAKTVKSRARKMNRAAQRGQAYMESIPATGVFEVFATGAIRAVSEGMGASILSGVAEAPDAQIVQALEDLSLSNLEHRGLWIVR